MTADFDGVGEDRIATRKAEFEKHPELIIDRDISLWREDIRRLAALEAPTKEEQALLDEAAANLMNQAKKDITVNPERALSSFLFVAKDYNNQDTRYAADIHLGVLNLADNHLDMVRSALISGKESVLYPIYTSMLNVVDKHKKVDEQVDRRSEEQKQIDAILEVIDAPDCDDATRQGSVDKLLAIVAETKGNAAKRNEHKAALEACKKFGNPAEMLAYIQQQVFPKAEGVSNIKGEGVVAQPSKEVGAWK